MRDTSAALNVIWYSSITSKGRNPAFIIAILLVFCYWRAACVCLILSSNQCTGNVGAFYLEYKDNVECAK